jgi:hypothetical protein
VQYPQVLVYEGDGRLAALLRPAIEARKWSLREPRGLAACIRLLRRGGPGVLVVKIGRDLEHELALLERVAWLFPDTATVVVGESDKAALAGVAWDLGAAYVLFPPQPRERLPEIVVGLMKFPGEPGADVPGSGEGHV